MQITEIIQKLDENGKNTKNFASTANALLPLFQNQNEYEFWKQNRNIKPLKTRELLRSETLCCFLGIDSGSTTTKILILDKNEFIIFQFYSANNGNPLKTVADGLQMFYDEISAKNIDLQIIGSCATGYGEDLIRSALNLDFGIVETMAHLQGAQWVDKNVSFVLDIGGQDMKSIFVRNGLISNIELNEACSSGCGSFLQNFAATMNLTLSEFAKKACLAANPADLGTRCTVFMNSKVKQSLRENATIGDIAAGLAYSVVKNCLFKVLKISNLNILGQNIVVQGGTFKNDAVYRALELLSGKTVSATNSPELMGALGAALYATRIKSEKLKIKRVAQSAEIQYSTKEIQCKGCTNSCTVLRFKFENGNVSYAGNKCEKIFFSKNSAKEKGYNSFEMKNENLFYTQTTQIEQSKTNKKIRENQSNLCYTCAKIGIPRILNMYENFPFWKTLFEGCGIEVVLSHESTNALYQSGICSVMSDNICFPAKLAHGHILTLVNQRVNRIFYPIVPKEEHEFSSASNSYNCPVVSGYPDVIRSAINPENFGIAYDTPVISFHDEKALEKSCWKYFSELNVNKKTFKQAFKTALQEKTEKRRQLIEFQQNLLQKSIAENRLLFVVAGRPYHTDLLINQKTGQILADLGIIALTDDVFRIQTTQISADNNLRPKQDNVFKHLNIVSQWSYPNRVIQTALEVARLPQNVQMIQLNSFGCGPDSFFMDEVSAILKNADKNLTIIRIDEISSPGSVRLRLRSLVESLRLVQHSRTQAHSAVGAL